MLATAALAIAAAQAQTVPSRGAVWSALDLGLNALCDGALESADCVSHPSAISVRRLACQAEPDGRALCRYQRRIATTGGRRARWDAAETRFLYHGGTMIWSLERDFPLTPGHTGVEGALQWQYGSLCRALIDACLDEEGNEMDPTPEFTVSQLECQPAADRRATCSFTSVAQLGANNPRPAERCTGTLQRRDHDGGETTWNFVTPEPRRRPYVALLSCN